MRKALILSIIAVVLLGSSLSAQTVTLKTYGISPRDAVKDSTDIFDRAYNGLLNVGVETQMYLKGAFEDSVLTSPEWTVVDQPTGSNAVIGATTDMGTDAQVAVFTPDVVGTYVVEFADGGQTAQVTINAGTYMGIEGGACAGCHGDKADEWAGTGHSSMLVRALNGTLSDHYAGYCIRCHTTGFDALAANDGFDDFPFVFPSVLQEGMYDSMKTTYPEAFKRANIQCESCHGPGSAHFSDISDSKMVLTLSADVCAWCHDSGTHHVFPEQWDASSHGKPKYAGYAGGRASCAPCHSGAGFVAYLEGGESPLAEAPPVTAITCATCHDPHSDGNPHQLRKVSPVALGDGTVVDKGGNGLLCMNCHKGRRNVHFYTGPDFSYSPHYGPHHGPQADMLAGANAATFGKKLPTSPHLTATEDACVTCHMAPGHADEDGNVILVGSHSFNVVDPDGNDNVAICQQCHGDVGDSFHEKKYYYNGSADHDGDGVEEGLQEEVAGMLEELAMMLPPEDSSAVDVGGDYLYTETEAKAAFNYLFVEEDRSEGVHNPAFTVALLKVSLRALINHSVKGDIVAIDDVPNDQGKQVRIIWGKMADDGIAVDPVSRYIVKRLDEDKVVWVGVGEHSADGSNRYALVVPTVYDSTAAGPALTTFKVVALTQGGMAYDSQPGQGYSIDNLVPAAPANLVAGRIGGSDIMLTWDDPVDEDFNYFAVYRSEVAGFEPSEDNLVATLTGVEFTDAALEMEKTYYYKVYAYDFSGNQSDPSDEVLVLMTGVDSKNANVPTEFSLAQNYPNPFNPSTVIEFGVPDAEYVSINVYDIRGALVRALTSGKYAAGYHSVVWDGRNDAGMQVSNGAYMYRLETESTTFTKKMLFLK